MPDNIVSLGFDYDNLPAAKKIIIDSLNEIFEAGQRVNNLNIGIGTAGLENFNKALKDREAAMAGLTASTDNYTKAQLDSAKAAKAHADAMAAENKTLQENVEARQRARNSMASYLKDQKDDAKLLKEKTITQAEYTKRINESTIKIEQYKNKIKDLDGAIKGQTATEAQAAKTREVESAKLEAQQKKEAKSTADAANEWKQLNIAYAEAALRAKNLAVIAPGSDAAKNAASEAKAIKDNIATVNRSVGVFNDEVGNYPKLGGYITALRGMRGPFKLLGEATGIGATQLDNFRLVVEHSLQGFNAFSRGGKDAADATKKMVVVEEEAAVATEGLSLGMKILAGAGILAVVAAVGYLIYSLATMKAATVDSNTSLGKLADSSKSVAKEFKELGNDPMKILIAATEELQKELDGLNEKLGLGTVTAAEKARAAIQDLTDTNKSYQQTIDAGTINDLGDESGLATAATQQQVQRNAAQIKESQTTVDEQDKAKREVDRRADHDLELKQQLDLAKDKEAINKETNARILSSETATLRSKIGAYRSNYEETLKIIHLEEAAVVNNSTSTQREWIAAQSKANADRLVATQEYLEETSKLTQDYSDKDRAAAYAIIQLALKEQSDAYKKIQEDDKQGAGARLGSQVQYFQLEMAQIENERVFKREKAGLTTKELELIDAESHAKITALNRDFLALNKSINEKAHADQLAENKAFEAKLVNDDDEANKRRLQIQKNATDDLAKLLGSNNSADKLAEISALDKNLETKLAKYKGNYDEIKKITEQYNRDKQRIDGEFAQRDADNEVTRQQNILAALKNGERLMDAEKERQRQAAITAQQNIVNNAQTNAANVAAGNAINTANAPRAKGGLEKFIESDKGKEIVSITQSTENAVVSIIDGRYQHEFDLIEQRKKLLEESTNREIEGINNSTLSQQEKQAQITLAEKKAADQRAVYAKQEKDLKQKQAIFDKSAAVLSIIENTLIQAAHFGWITPPAIAVEAAGAAGLVTLLAKSLPAYAEGVGIEGRPTHKGGLFIAGEAGPEIVAIDGKNPQLVDRATLFTGGINTKVRPILDNVVADLSERGMNSQFAQMAYYNSIIQGQKGINEERIINGIADAVVKSGSAVERAIKKQVFPTPPAPRDFSHDAYIYRVTKG